MILKNLLQLLPESTGKPRILRKGKDLVFKGEDGKEEAVNSTVARIWLDWDIKLRNLALGESHGFQLLLRNGPCVFAERVILKSPSKGRIIDI